MTGGTVVVLGSIGPNFGAGMTGGRAYLLDAALDRLSAGVMARPLEEDDRSLLELLAAHSAEGSTLAATILQDWTAWRGRFAVVEAMVSETPASVEPLAVAR
jgi:glutamate synthase (NADPH/NADH) large chain